MGRITARVAAAVAIAILVAGSLTGCSPSPTAERSVPPAPTTGSPSGRLPVLQDPADPMLVVYCSMQDRIVRLEGTLLSDPLATAIQVARMRQAQRAANLAVANFHRYHRADLERLAAVWAASFTAVRTRLVRGQREIDALRPAIRALGALERVYSCELDG
jgi:hypothetical protein